MMLQLFGLLYNFVKAMFYAVQLNKCLIDVCRVSQDKERYGAFIQACHHVSHSQSEVCACQYLRNNPLLFA